MTEPHSATTPSKPGAAPCPAGVALHGPALRRGAQGG